VPADGKAPIVPNQRVPEHQSAVATVFVPTEHANAALHTRAKPATECVVVEQSSAAATETAPTANASAGLAGRATCATLALAPLAIQTTLIVLETEFV